MIIVSHIILGNVYNCTNGSSSEKEEKKVCQAINKRKKRAEENM